jgi:hypothetical protein
MRVRDAEGSLLGGVLALEDRAIRRRVCRASTTGGAFMKTPTARLIAVLRTSDSGDAYGPGVHGFGADWYVLEPSGSKVDDS